MPPLKDSFRIFEGFDCICKDLWDCFGTLPFTWTVWRIGWDFQRFFKTFRRILLVFRGFLRIFDPFLILRLWLSFWRIFWDPILDVSTLLAILNDLFYNPEGLVLQHSKRFFRIFHLVLLFLGILEGFFYKHQRFLGSLQDPSTFFYHFEGFFEISLILWDPFLWFSRHFEGFFYLQNDPWWYFWILKGFFYTRQEFLGSLQNPPTVF